MAQNNLPIIAIGIAALFLLRKKGAPTPGATGATTNGNGGNGKGGDYTPETPREYSPGTYEMKIGETVRLLPSRKYFADHWPMWLNGEMLSMPHSHEAAVYVDKDSPEWPVHGSLMYENLDFYANEPGTWKIRIRSYDNLAHMDDSTPTGYADSTDDEFVFVIS